MAFLPRGYTVALAGMGETTGLSVRRQELRVRRRELTVDNLLGKVTQPVSVSTNTTDIDTQVESTDETSCRHSHGVYKLHDCIPGKPRNKSYVRMTSQLTY